jgi:hypothetical protein
VLSTIHNLIVHVGGVLIRSIGEGKQTKKWVIRQVIKEVGLSNISKCSVLVLGGSFGGLTAAFEIKRKLGDKVDVRVIARQEEFVFIPSLIWLVPGWRRSEQIIFDLKPALESKNIEFIMARVDQIKAEENKVSTTSGDFSYDYLVIATDRTLIGMKFPVWDLMKDIPSLYVHYHTQ